MRSFLYLAASVRTVFPWFLTAFFTKYTIMATVKDRYLNPFTDFGFKKLFGEESQKDLLIDFLNALLPPKHHIRDLQYTRNEYMGGNADARRAIMDITCTSDTGERFIVELQKAKQNYFKERSVYYSTFPIREQGERGNWNFELAAVYCVGVLDFVFDEDKGSTEYLHTVQLKNQQNRVFYDKLTFVYLEMPNFTKTEAELITNTDKWLYFLKYLPDFQDIPTPLQSSLFEHAFHTAELAQFNDVQRDSYEQSLKIYRDLKNTMDYAIEQAEAKGLAQGMESGLQKGILLVAKNMKESGMPLKDIAKLTSVSESDLATL